jgi:GntR family transcriptional regulator
MSTLVRDPIYQQLNQALRALIRSGEFQPRAQFLTERQVCERFNVSRATANKALSNLVAEGVLEFRKGIGTFVRGDGLNYDLRALVSFTEKAIYAGKRPSTEVLSMDWLRAQDIEPEVAGALELAPDAPVYYVERLRLADDLPVILERRHIAARYCPGLTMVQFEESLYAIWTSGYGLQIAGADERIRAVILHGSDARLLRVPGGQAGFLVLSTGYLAGGSPLWYERTLYRGDAYEFHNRLGPVQSARPVAGSLIDIDDQTRERLAT